MIASEVLMNKRIGSFYLLFIIGLGLVGCAATPDSGSAPCTVHRFEEVVRDPIAHSDKVFCGEAFILESGRTVRILATREQMPPSNDLAFLVTARSRSRLKGLSAVPRRFYLEARIDPVEQCFLPSGSDEDCAPFRRPVYIQIFRAQPRPLTGQLR